jgi:hypothetical protein
VTTVLEVTTDIHIKSASADLFESIKHHNLSQKLGVELSEGGALNELSLSTG